MTAWQRWYQSTVILIDRNIRRFRKQTCGQLLRNILLNSRLYIPGWQCAGMHSLHTCPSLHETGKLKKNSGMIWPMQSPELNLIQKVWRTITLNLQSDTEVIMTRRVDRRSLQNSIWRSPPVGYIRNLYASIPRRLRTVIVSKGIPNKCWPVEV